MKFARSAAFVLLALSAATAVAAQPEDKTLTAAAPRNYVTTNGQGQVVALDRATGKIRPLTADEAQRLAQGILQLANRSTEGLVQVHHADGAVSMDLQGRFQDVMLAKKNEDGTIEQACIDNPAAAAAFFEIDPALVGAATAAVSNAPADLPIR